MGDDFVEFTLVGVCFMIYMLAYDAGEAIEVLLRVGCEYT